MPTGPLAPATLCRQCRRPLDSVELYLDDKLVGYDYVHTALDVRGDGHEPDPILRADAAGSAVTVCDFCAAPGPRWTYGCLPFNYEGINAGSADDWAACDRCHDLVEAGEWDELAERGQAGMTFHTGITISSRQLSFMRDKVRAMHQQFVAHRTGPATLDTP